MIWEIEGALIVRKHNEKECVYLMEQWWEQIKNYSHRDQLSFNYVLWKTGKKIIFSGFNNVLYHINFLSFINSSFIYKIYISLLFV